MLIGIVSDSHGKHLAVREAIELFNGLGVEHVIHCGDVGSTEVFDELVGRPCTFVWGNMDDPNAGADAYLQTVGISPPGEIPRIIELDGKRLAVFHGHERSFKRAAQTLKVDYIFHGHTHTPRNDSVNGTRIINPGALFHANPKTVATLDTATDEVTFHEIRGE